MESPAGDSVTYLNTGGTPGAATPGPSGAATLASALPAASALTPAAAVRSRGGRRPAARQQAAAESGCWRPPPSSCWDCWPCAPTFLGTVRAGDLSARRAEHSRFPYVLPAERSAVQSSDGADLAIDRLGSPNVTASPNLVTEPVGVAARLHPSA